MKYFSLNQIPPHLQIESRQNFLLDFYFILIINLKFHQMKSQLILQSLVLKLMGWS